MRSPLLTPATKSPQASPQTLAPSLLALSPQLLVLAGLLAFVWSRLGIIGDYVLAPIILISYLVMAKRAVVLDHDGVRKIPLIPFRGAIFVPWTAVGDLALQRARGSTAITAPFLQPQSSKKIRLFPTDGLTVPAVYGPGWFRRALPAGELLALAESYRHLRALTQRNAAPPNQLQESREFSGDQYLASIAGRLKAAHFGEQQPPSGAVAQFRRRLYGRRVTHTVVVLSAPRLRLTPQTVEDFVGTATRSALVGTSAFWRFFLTTVVVYAVMPIDTIPEDLARFVGSYDPKGAADSVVVLVNRATGNLVLSNAPQTLIADAKRWLSPLPSGETPTS